MATPTILAIQWILWFAVHPKMRRLMGGKKQAAIPGMSTCSGSVCLSTVKRGSYTEVISWFILVPWSF